MPENNVHKVDIDKLNRAISKKILVCPACQQRGTLSVMPTLMELREFHGGDFVVGGSPIVPLAVLTCNNCGNTILINALAVGLLDEQQKPAEVE